MKILVVIALVHILFVVVCRTGGTGDVEYIFYRPYDTYYDYEKSQMVQKDFYKFLKNYYRGDANLPRTKNIIRTVPKLEQSGTETRQARQSYDIWCPEPVRHMSPICARDANCDIHIVPSTTSYIIKGAMVNHSDDQYEYEYCPQVIEVVSNCCKNRMSVMKREMQRSTTFNCTVGYGEVIVVRRESNSNEVKIIKLSVPTSCTSS